MPQELTSRDNPKVKYACRLAQSAAFREQERSFFAEGLKLCLDLARAGMPLRFLFYTAAALQKTPALAGFACEQFVLSAGVADKMAQGQSSQGVFAVFAIPRSDPGLLCPGRRLLALEGVQDPGNVGALLRSAAAFGYDAALLFPGCASPWSPKALRASMGTAGTLPVLELPDAETTVRQLNEMGYATLAAALYQSRPMDEIPRAYPGGVCLWIGSEGQGLSPAVQAACTAAVRIPIGGRVESLNAAVAGGILLWYFGGGGGPADG